MCMYFTLRARKKFPKIQIRTNLPRVEKERFNKLIESWNKGLPEQFVPISPLTMLSACFSTSSSHCTS